MMEHECNHEVDFALMSERIGQILSGQDDIRSTQREIKGIIFGNGKHGLKTEITRNRDAIKRMWWAVGAVFLALTGLTVQSLM